MTDLVIFGLGAPTKFSPSILGNGVGGHAARFAKSSNFSVKAVARDPSKYEAQFKDICAIVKGDVTDRQSVAESIASCKAAIFAVQAADSVPAMAVDRDALILVAEECVKANCKLVVISSMFVSPKHRFNPLRVVLNTIVKWNMMDAKWQGEEALRNMKGLRYVIIRPASLNDGPTSSLFQVGQGDYFMFGRYPVSKADTGKVAVLAAMQEDLCQVTFELAGSVQAVDEGNLFATLKKD